MILVTTAGSGSMDLYAAELSARMPDVPILEAEKQKRLERLFNRSLLSLDSLCSLRVDYDFVKRIRDVGEPLHFPSHHMARYGMFLQTPYVVTVHDLIRYFDIQRHQPLIHRPNLRDRMYLALDYAGIKRADAIVGYVKAVGEAGATRIEEERLRAGPYRSLFDFTQRTGLSREASKNLIQIGAFDDLGLNRRELIWQLGLFAGGFEQSELRHPRDRQMRLDLPTVQDEVRLADFTAYQRMASDYAVLRLSPDSPRCSSCAPPWAKALRLASTSDRCPPASVPTSRAWSSAASSH